ncbi:sugar phosphate isomerase/epimerase family protein [Sphingomonas tabacisoli]|uniref:Sugar phosphate isomerase/epimerase family protein n=1 Tax=Sphingomonas tabacisoli TaxID=2249466 RepID=A0ABW4I6T0_9SPHN
MVTEPIRPLSRRSLLAGMAALTAGGCAITRSGTAPRRPLGLADLTVIKPLAGDYAGTLKRVAHMGYSHFGFRLAGYSAADKSELPPAEKARLVRDAGLQVGVVRYGMGDNFAKQAEDAAAIGASVIALSAAPVFFRGRKLGETTRAAFDAWLPELGRMAETARALGLRLAYHNHWWDHVPLDGTTPLDLIARNFSPRDVAFEIDLAWAFLGGVDPLSLVRSLGPRVLAMHFKDVNPALGTDRMKQLVVPGTGVLDYPTLIPQLDEVTKAIGYVEVDMPKDGLAEAASAAELIQSARRV